MNSAYQKEYILIIVRTPTTTQPNITKVGFDTKMTLQHPTLGTQCWQYCSCYMYDFNQTLTEVFAAINNKILMGEILVNHGHFAFC